MPLPVNEWLRRQGRGRAKASNWGNVAAGPKAASIAELLAQDALFKTVAGVEQHPHRDGFVGQHLDAADVARLIVIGDRSDRALVALEHLDDDKGGVGEQCPAPASWPERADRREREQRGVDRQDRPCAERL